MSIAVVATAQAHGSASSTETATTASTGTGNQLFIATSVITSGIGTPTDGFGNPFTGGTAQVVISGKDVNIGLFYKQDSVAGSTSVTVPLSGASNSSTQINIFYWEFSGLVSSGTLADQSDQDDNTSGSTSWTSNGGLGFPTTAPSELVIGIGVGFDVSTTITGPASPWVNQAAINNSASSLFSRSIAGYQIVSATGTYEYSGSFGASNGWLAGVASYIGLTTAAKSDTEASSTASDAVTHIGVSSAQSFSGLRARVPLLRRPAGRRPLIPGTAVPALVRR